jgi:transposase
VNLLERWGWEILQHPPYSPDLAPSDFHLFPNMKKHLRAKRFKSHDDVKLEVQTWLCGQDPTFYLQGVDKWISRLDKCINREGDYVEK